jgi:hypothetical protein
MGSLCFTVFNEFAVLTNDINVTIWISCFCYYHFKCHVDILYMWMNLALVSCIFY